MFKFISKISSKLVGLAVLNTAAFAAVALIAGIGFFQVETLSSDIVGKEVAAINDNAHLGREISSLFSDIEGHTRVCNEKNYSNNMGKQLTNNMSRLFDSVQNPALRRALGHFQITATSLIQECLQLNTALINLREADQQTETTITLLEQAIGSALIKETLDGKLTNHFDQLMVLVAGLRETQLLIGKLTAEQAHLNTPDSSLLLSSENLVDDMSLRLQTLTASTTDIANASGLLGQNLKRYRDSLFQYQQANMSLEKRVLEVHETKRNVLDEMRRIDLESYNQAAEIQDEIVTVVRNLNFNVVALSLVIGLFTLLIVGRINRRDIKEPLNRTLGLIQGIRHDSAIDEPTYRDDEWGVIQKSLVDMAFELKSSQLALITSRDRLETALDGSNDGLWDWNLETDEVYSSPRLKSMLGYAPDELEGDFSSWLQLIDPLQKEKVLAFVTEYLEGEVGKYDIEFRMLHKHGHWVEILSRGKLAHDAEGRVSSPRRLIGTHTDITARKTAERQLQRSEKEQRTLITALPDVIMRFDSDARYLFMSENVSSVLDLKAAYFVGKSHTELGFPEEACQAWDSAIKHTFETGKPCDIELVLDGAHGNKTFNWKLTPDFDEHNNVRSVLGVARDISLLKEHQKRLEKIAHYDVLTGLPNRILLSDRLLQMMNQVLRRNAKLAVVYIDLDGFKEVNDQYGHDAGDRLLKIVAARMKLTLREGDTLARLGGDEFVAVLQDLADVSSCEPMLHRLLEAVSADVMDNGVVLNVTASLGVTFFPQVEEINADQLLRQADQAMYQVKLSGKNRFHLYDMDHDRSMRGQHESIERIREGLNKSEFLLYYQPKVNMSTGQVVGVEALIRWQHPEKGLRPPAEFLPIIEEQPLSVEMGNWVIKQVFEQSSLWRKAGVKLPVSINIGALQIQQADFVVKLTKMLSDFPDVPPKEIELEVLETSALDDIVQTSKVIRDCIELGLQVSIDDFGTGYSSLTYLKRLPVNTLKIDQSFVRDMLDDPDDLAILEGVIGLARAFRRNVVAEGVETTAHGSMLLDFGCELAQGYAIAYPMPANNIPEWISSWRTPDEWFNRKVKSRHEQQIQFAAVEHQAWIRQVEAALNDGAEAPPMSCDACRFGSWFYHEGQAYYGDSSAYEAVDRIHRQVHSHANNLLVLKSEGDESGARDGILDLHQLKHSLLKQLDKLNSA
ncbi:EAL domain-containing protein [Amphritea sp.]|uniref:EAL domain-containing protein n=1 Tax=Amphritea sp. TaxID=1872502 RepID=UPI0025C3487B|nr:EAL domain-containing protein [Amphritea sp.]